MATCADSLATIKQLMFDEKRFTGAELLQAVKDNWVDYSLATNGTLMNLRFPQDAVAGVEGRDNLVSFIDEYMAKGAMHVQFNVMGVATMKAAQKKPEDYKDMLVRVAGYSAYFVELGKPLQKDLIQRTELHFRFLRKCRPKPPVAAWAALPFGYEHTLQYFLERGNTAMKDFRFKIPQTIEFGMGSLKKLPETCPRRLAFWLSMAVRSAITRAASRFPAPSRPSLPSPPLPAPAAK